MAPGEARCAPHSTRRAVIVVMWGVTMPIATVKGPIPRSVELLDRVQTALTPNRLPLLSPLMRWMPWANPRSGPGWPGNSECRLFTWICLSPACIPFGG